MRKRFLQIFAVVIGAWLPLASACAQPVYSVNALGYVDANFVAGSNLIANPLFAGDNTISNLFRDVPEGSFFLPWDQGSKTFSPTNRFTLGSGWSDPNAVFLAPSGGFLWLPAPTRISFVGQPWGVIPGPCLNYPAGESVFSWIDQQQIVCVIHCDCNEPFEHDGNVILTWNRQTQAYNPPLTYLDGVGWLPSPPRLDVTESAHFFTDVPIDGRGPFAGLLGGGPPAPQGLPWLNLRNPERSGTNLTFHWPSTSNVNYAVFCSTNLNTVVWELVQEGISTPTDGVATISVVGTNSGAYYRVLPQFGASTVLLGGARGASNFTFQLYAPVATNYVVQRTRTWTYPISSATWQTITNVTAGPSNIVSVVDTTATADTGYYRVYH